MICERLEDEDEGVRIAALHGLAQVAEKGDAAVVKVVKERLEDDDEDVRQAATEALAEIADLDPSALIAEGLPVPPKREFTDAN